MLDNTLSFIKRFIPAKLFRVLQAPYHYKLALLGNLWYGFPSRKLTVIAVTGTKGKTTTTELVNAILEEAGLTVALANTVRFKIADTARPNRYKMTLPGRFFLPRFLSEALAAGCTHAVIEISSEAVPQYRHRFLDLDALIFTNLAPEHIESHGSYEAYVAAKLEIARRVLLSKKPRRMLVLNADDKESKRFAALNVPETVFYRLEDAVPHSSSPDGTTLTFRKRLIRSRLPGEFNIYNMLAALTLGETLGIEPEVMRRALERFEGVPGRAERIDAGQSFSAIVDYAHTPESLEALYTTYPGRKICVFGATGGGRDRAKRPRMGAMAGAYCDAIVLTDDDSYDENPIAIADDIRAGLPESYRGELTIQPDRRRAIALALSGAKRGDTVLITGKGTDPFLMGPRGKRTPWSDAAIVHEEIQKLLSASGAI